MAHFRGKLLSAADVVQDDVGGEIYVRPSPGGLPSWDGAFDVHQGRYPPVGQTFTLALDDGRRGPIRISRLNTGSRQQAVAFFQGSGPLH